MIQRPSADLYDRALGTMLFAKALTPKYRELVVAHYNAPNHTATTRELASAMGWDSHSPVNAHYGTLAHNLAQRMRWAVPDGSPDAITVADFEGGTPDEGETRWVMCPELVAALENHHVVPTPRGS